jgi:hypothetical protein
MQTEFDESTVHVYLHFFILLMGSNARSAWQIRAHPNSRQGLSTMYLDGGVCLHFVKEILRPPIRIFLIRFKAKEVIKIDI